MGSAVRNTTNTETNLAARAIFLPACNTGPQVVQQELQDHGDEQDPAIAHIRQELAELATSQVGVGRGGGVAEDKYLMHLSTLLRC